MADRPRTFAEVVAAESPEGRARWERADSYSDAAVANDFHADVWVIEDRNHPGDWRVEYQDAVRSLAVQTSLAFASNDENANRRPIRNLGRRQAAQLPRHQSDGNRGRRVSEEQRANCNVVVKDLVTGETTAVAYKVR